MGFSRHRFDMAKVFWVIPWLCVLTTAEHTEFHLDPDANRNVSGLITSKGYPVEEHHVTTEDGYILGIQRIPHGRQDPRPSKTSRPAVLLQHGLLSSAADFVVNFPHQSPGFILADAGYDVWLGNFRGSTYSRQHVNLTTKDREYWHFSFDEMGLKDLPATIDYVLNKTGQSSLYYMGHSQGTMTMFILLSEKPQYNQKVKLFVALAPVSRVDHIKSPIRLFAPFSNEMDILLDWLGEDEFLPNNNLIKFLGDTVCNSELKFICENIIFLLCGFDKAQLNVTRLPVYTSHSPAGTSARNVAHFGQLVNAKKFQMFDFGERVNVEKYGQPTPPEFPVQNITAPVALFCGDNDWLAVAEDVEWLRSKLRNVVESFTVPDPKWSHVDFIFATDAGNLLYQEVLKVMAKQHQSGVFKGHKPVKVHSTVHYL